MFGVLCFFWFVSWTRFVVETEKVENRKLPSHSLKFRVPALFLSLILSLWGLGSFWWSRNAGQTTNKLLARTNLKLLASTYSKWKWTFLPNVWDLRRDSNLKLSTQGSKLNMQRTKWTNDKWQQKKYYYSRMIN